MTIKEATRKFGKLENFRYRHEGDTILWTRPIDMIGIHLFSFDKKTVYNLFSDFPQNLTVDQVKVFCKENPFWITKYTGFNKRIREMGIEI